MIGFSLSACVLEILAGKIAIAEVERIITSICFQTQEQYQEIIANYKQIYWHKFPESQVDALLEVLTLEFPRNLRPARYPSIVYGVWVSDPAEIWWINEDNEDEEAIA